MLSSQNMNKLRYWVKWSGVIVFEERGLCGNEFMNNSFSSSLDQGVNIYTFANYGKEEMNEKVNVPIFLPPHHTK